MILFRKFTYISILLLAQGCAATGGKHISSFDEFTGVRTNMLTLGSTKRITSATGNLINEDPLYIAKDDTSKDYYFIIDSYTEGDGKGCPHADTGNKVILLTNNRKFESELVSSGAVNKMQIGLFAPSCSQKDMKFGPFTKQDLNELIEDNSFKFKIYSRNYHLDGIVDEKQTSLIKEFINKN